MIQQQTRIATPDFLTVLACQHGKRAAKRYTDPTQPPDDYDAGMYFTPIVQNVDSLKDLAAILAQLRAMPGAFVVRGRVKPGTPAGLIARRKHDRDGQLAALEPAAHHWVALDADETSTPFDKSDPRGSVERWRASLAEGLRNADCVFHFSAKQHLAPNVRGRAWFWSDRPLTDEEGDAWACAHGLDPATFRTVQPIYTSDPVFDGCVDPIDRSLVHLDGGLARFEFSGEFGPKSAPYVQRAPGQHCGLFHAMLAERGDVVRENEPGKWTITCPREHEHSSSGGSGTVLWAPRDGQELGSIHCTHTSHGHDKLTAQDWLDCFDASERAAAKAALYPAIASMAANAVTLPERVPLELALAIAAPNATQNMAPLANAATPAAAQPYILQSATHAESILLWRGADRGHQPVALGSLRTVIRDTGLSDVIALFERVEAPNGKVKIVKLSPATIVERNGKSFDRTAYDFARRVSVYDPDRSLVVVGYPNAVPVAAYDADVDAWLRALAGEAYPRLAVWIASCSQRHINRLAAALVLIGPADVGKSLFSCAVAGLWGAVTPPAASLLIKQFNGELKNCAVVCDEEAQLFGSKQLSTKRFRDITQSTERSIELKGLETFTLKGALRIIVPCNEISDLRFTDLGGPDIVQAVIDRLCVIDCKPRKDECKAALARLRLPGGWVCDRDRVIAHLAWLCDTVELPAERFLGAGAGADSVLAGHVRDTADVWETLHVWLDADECSAQVWSARAGKGLCVNPGVLAQAICTVGKGWDLRGVRCALEPFKRGEYHPRGEPRLWVLDDQRVAVALELDEDRSVRLAYRLGTAATSQVRLFGGQYDGRGAHHA